MRERERNHRERNQEAQWTIVNHKKTRTHHNQAIRTCFVNHLPPSTTIPDLAKVFRTHGAISYISIPATQKNPKYKFAFVQFSYPQSLVTAIRDENGRRLLESKITVFPAKFDKKPPSLINPNLYHHQPQTKPHRPSNPTPSQRTLNTRDNRSYKEVTNANTHSPQLIATPTATKQTKIQPTQHRKKHIQTNTIKQKAAKFQTFR